MNLIKRLTTLETEQVAANEEHDARASAAFLERIRKTANNIIAKGDFEHKPGDSRATNFVRAQLRGEAETAKRILAGSTK